MELNKCTLEEGIMLFKMAGYEILLYTEGWQILENEEVVAIYSDLKLLQDPTFILRAIIRPINYSKGIAEGVKEVKDNIKSYLGIK